MALYFSDVIQSLPAVCGSLHFYLLKANRDSEEIKLTCQDSHLWFPSSGDWIHLFLIDVGQILHQDCLLVFEQKYFELKLMHLHLWFNEF